MDIGIRTALSGAERRDGYFAVPLPHAPLPFSGERMTSAAKGVIEIEHLHRYCLARDICQGRDVLDIAAGEGYGAAILAGVARSVTGIEIDVASAAHARASYPGGNLRFVAGDALAIPLADASMDVVISFETLEHLPDQGRFLAEVRRVLRPGGVFVVSTPERSVYSSGERPPNPYHVLELTAGEFSTLLGAHFAVFELLMQRALLGSVIATESRGGWRSFERRSTERVEATAGLARAEYLIGIASDAALPQLPSSTYLDARALRAAIELPDALAAAQAELAQMRAERDAVLSSGYWRVGAPVRLLARHFPRAARRLRQVTQFLWWTLTLQIGHRYLLWRRGRSG